MSTVGTAHPFALRDGEEQPTQMRGDGNGVFCVYLYSLSLECFAQYYTVLSCLITVYSCEKLQTFLY